MSDYVKNHIEAQPRLKEKFKEFGIFTSEFIQSDESVITVFFCRMIQNGKTHSGLSILTNKRLCFVEKFMFSRFFDTINLSKITSINSAYSFGKGEIIINVSDNETVLKMITYAPVVSYFVSKIEEARDALKHPSAAKGDKISDIQKLKELKVLAENDIITLSEYENKKKEILDRL